MHPSSPWAQWHPAQPGSLKRRLDKKRNILPEDLALILEHNPGCVPDKLLRELLLRALRGELRTPRGRPPGKLSVVTLMAADVWIELEAEDIRKDIASGAIKRTRGDLEPMKLAAKRVASRLGNFTGRHLLNRISAMKNERL